MKKRPLVPSPLVYYLLLLAVVFPVLVLAQGGNQNTPPGGNTNPFNLPPNLITPPPSSTGQPLTSINGGQGSVINLINQILYWVSAIFWIAAAGFVIYAAYLYLTGGGDPERIKKAHKQLLWAVVAIAIGILSSGLPVLIRSFLSGT